MNIPIFTLLPLLLHLFATTTSSTTYNIISLGACHYATTDPTHALSSAWAAACASAGPATVLIPLGRFLIHNAVSFQGRNCRSKAIKFVIRGTLVAPTDYRVLGNSGTWLSFEDVTDVTISGGILDGLGAGLWACKKAGKGCPSGFTTLGFTNSMNIVINGLTSLNSQLYHIVINGCKNVKMLGVRVSASGVSPNADGIHVQLSTGVTILGSKVSTGVDCVSIGAGTCNLWIEKMSCGPGHGISIGSLGKDLNEPGVQNVTVKTATFIGTENGVRIKSWGRASNGFVRNVLFQNLTIVNAQNPIIIDQNYCPDNKDCPGKVSGVRISDITYQDIHGSSAIQVAMKFDCSSKYHCMGVKLQDVRLTYKNQVALSTCVNVGGSTYGLVEPKSCL